MNHPTSLEVDAQLAPAGAAAASFARLSSSIWHSPHLSAELLELCRLTLARLHHDELESRAANPHLPAPPGASRRDAVLAGQVARSADFTDAERGVLEFAEVHALDAQAITDDLAARVTNHLGEPGLVFLIEALGILDGRMRSARCLRDLAGQPL